jgi:hypothetical protein
MKTHTKWYQYVESLQFSHNDMNIMALKCVMPQKSAIFCISWKEKILDEPLKNPIKHSSQQNWFVDVPKSSQMHHWSKAKAAKFEKMNIINIIKGIKSIKVIKFIYTCRSQVEKKIITW